MEQRKPIIKYGFFLIVLFSICISCNKEESYIDIPNENSQKEKPENKIEYYVKYQSDVFIPISRTIMIDLTIETEKGVLSLSVPRNWEGTFGPFKDLRVLYISSKTSGYNPNSTHCRGRISISKGNQPFVLKADESFKGTSYRVYYAVQNEDLE